MTPSHMPLCKQCASFPTFSSLAGPVFVQLFLGIRPVDGITNSTKAYKFRYVFRLLKMPRALSDDADFL